MGEELNRARQLHECIPKRLSEGYFKDALRAAIELLALLDEHSFSHTVKLSALLDALQLAVMTTSTLPTPQRFAIQAREINDLVCHPSSQLQSAEDLRRWSLEPRKHPNYMTGMHCVN